MNTTLRIAFDQVDETTDPADFVRYLDATRATDFFRKIKRRGMRGDSSARSGASSPSSARGGVTGSR